MDLLKKELPISHETFGDEGRSCGGQASFGLFRGKRSVVAHHDPGLEPELGDEALGSGGNVGGQAHEGHKVLVDQAAGSSAGRCSDPACSTGRGASVERHTV